MPSKLFIAQFAVFDVKSRSCSTMLYQVQPEADHHKCLLARINTLLFQQYSVHLYLLLLCCSQFDTLLLRLGLSSLITTSCSYSVYTLLLQYYCGFKGSTIIMQLPPEMFRFQLPSPITAAYAVRHSHAHCVFLVIIIKVTTA